VISAVTREPPYAPSAGGRPRLRPQSPHTARLRDPARGRARPEAEQDRADARGGNSTRLAFRPPRTGQHDNPCTAPLPSRGYAAAGGSLASCLA
jgi:hypothetical protein